MRKDEYVAPEIKHTNLSNLPAVSQVNSDPLGVVLVIGAWNYPVQLTLLPVVGAIAAGNAVAIRLPSDKYCPNVATAIKSLVEKYLDPECFCCLKGQCE